MSNLNLKGLWIPIEVLGMRKLIPIEEKLKLYQKRVAKIRMIWYYLIIKNKRKQETKKWLEPLIHYIWINLINGLTVWGALPATQNEHTAYLSSTGLFAEEKIYLTNNRVRDG